MRPPEPQLEPEQADLVQPVDQQYAETVGHDEPDRQQLQQQADIGAPIGRDARFGQYIVVVLAVRRQVVPAVVINFSIVVMGYPVFFAFSSERFLLRKGESIIIPCSLVKCAACGGMLSDWIPACAGMTGFWIPVCHFGQQNFVYFTYNGLGRWSTK